MMMGLCFSAPLAEYSGNDSADFITEHLSSSIVANVGQNPDSSVPSQGYWVSAATTPNDGASSTAVAASFSYTATGLEDGEMITLDTLTLDYTRLELNGSAPVMNVYVNNGDGYGSSLYTVNDTPASSSVTETHHIPMGVTLSNGEQVTIGFAFADIHMLSSRTHILDNLELQGSFEQQAPDRLTSITLTPPSDVIASLSGEASADELNEYLSLTIGGNSGLNPEGSITDNGYWTSAATTANDSAPVSAISTTFEISGEALPAGSEIIFRELTFDYNRFSLNGNAPVMNLYLDTGSGYGDAIFTESSNPLTSNNYNRYTIPFYYTLSAGNSLTIGIAFSDNKGLPSRTHVIDDLILTGTQYILSAGNSDFNTNGVSDLWERRYGATELVETAESRMLDADNDGVSNYEESLAGTNPFSAESRLAIHITQNELNNLGLILPSVLGKAYRIQVCEDLDVGNWVDAGDLLYGIDGDIQLTFDPALYRQYFYRAVVLDLDADQDGLTQWEEEQLDGFTDDSAVSNAELLAVNAGEEFSETEDTPRDLAALQRLIADAQLADVTISIDNDMLYESEQIGADVTITRTPTTTNTLIDLETVLAFEITNDALVASNGVDSSDYQITDSDGHPLLDNIVILPAGVSSTTFTITPVDDGIIESDEVLTLLINGEPYQKLWIADAETISVEDHIAISQAGHFLSQASMGGTPAEIASLANEIQDLGVITACENWIESQFSLPRDESTFTEDCYTHQALYLWGSSTRSVNIQNFEMAWWNKTIQSKEQLRNRIAFALSQIFVTSSAFWANEERNNIWQSYTLYYDQLMDRAFGTHRDLLTDISYDPFMGLYLSSAQNRKANPELGTSPDENYAREVMQLFSCGVYAYDQDGQFTYDSAGNRLENYTNEDITELARVFTGLGLSVGDGVLDDFDAPRTNRSNRFVWPMTMSEEHHDQGSKVLLDGSIIAANQGGDADITQALDTLALHPSTAPFISRQLIKRLTSSNPSAAYIGRVVEAWNGNGPYGSGTVGDFSSVIKAILLDTEARQAVEYTVADGLVTASPTRSASARICEPILKWTQFYRFSQCLSGEDDGWIRFRPKTKRSGSDETPHFGQIPMRAPSVFNYYDTDYSPSVGDLAEAEEDLGINLVAPESEILSPYVIHQFETLYTIVNQDSPSSSFNFDGNESLPTSVSYNYLRYLFEKNATVEEFIDDINLWFCKGQISPELSSTLASLANSTGGATTENFAGLLSIIFNSSDFSVIF